MLLLLRCAGVFSSATMLAGKVGLAIGVASKHSIATAVAHVRCPPQTRNVLRTLPVSHCPVDAHPAGVSLLC